MGSAERKSKFLGINFSKASQRLRKLILFNLLKKHNENVCVRCNKIIENPDDLSIEHILPWENVSIDLFWDLNNIAFSHKKCNVPHKYNSSGKHLRKIGPKGTSWCSRHQKFFSIENFNFNRSRWNGFHHLCKECQHYSRSEFWDLTPD